MDPTVRGGNLFGTMMAVRGGPHEPEEDPGPSRLPGEEDDDAEEKQEQQHLQQQQLAWQDDLDDGEDGEIAGLTDELSKGASVGSVAAHPTIPKEVAEAMKASLLAVHIRNHNLGGITKKGVPSRTTSSGSSRSTASSSQREQRSAYLQRVHLAHVTDKPTASRPPGSVSPPNEPLLPPLLPQLAPPRIHEPPPHANAG